MTVRVTHSLDDLYRDVSSIPRRASASQAKIVRRTAERGNGIARRFARQSAGRHGRHYPDAFSAEMKSPTIWEYGPDSAKKQGGMSFEYGSRNQPPHLDLNKSADIVAPKMQQDVRDMLDGLFW